MSDRPDALYLADVIENDPTSKAHHDAAASCLRRQPFEIEALKAERNALRGDAGQDWSLLDASQESLREHMLEIHRLQDDRDALIEAIDESCELLRVAISALRTLKETEK